MANVKLSVVVDDKQLLATQKTVEALDNKKISIKVDTTGLAALDKDSLKTLNSLTKLVKAEAQLESAQARSSKQMVESAKQEAKATAASENRAAAEAKATAATERRRTAEIKAESATRKDTSAIKEQTKATKDLGTAHESMLKHIVVWRLITTAISTMLNGLREALRTMKEIDSELVTVRKVTGFSDAQIAALEENAYAISTKYGQTAQAYLESVAAFARAGYKEQAEALAELATKTQLVGDMTAETANQFLIAVDAGYKYQGNIEQLTHVLDAANELDNKYATSLEKLADGMGIVAPVAAQLHVSVDELLAMLGTVSAVTQRSGSEAARALRAVLINLTNDVNATFKEVDGEITYAIGEIDGLSDVVKLYAKDLYDTAQATGKILNPTEVLEALVKAAEEGRLNEQELYNMVTDESGKLRAAQLWALISNWNTMYKSMLEDTQNAIGSADKEITPMLNSLESKLNILKNTWTQTVRQFVDSGFLKIMVDGANKALKIFQHLGGIRTALIGIGTYLASMGIAKIPAAVSSITGALSKLRVVLSGNKAAMEAAGISAKDMAKTFSSVASIAATAISVIWSVVSNAVQKEKEEIEKRRQALYEESEKAQESSQNILNLYEDFSKARVGTDEFTSSLQKLADALGVDVPESADEAIKKIRELTAEQLRANAAEIASSKYTAGQAFLESSNAQTGNLSGVNLDFLDWQKATGTNDNAIISAWNALYDEYYSFIPGYGGAKNRNTFDVETAVAYRKELERIVQMMNAYALRTGDTAVYESTAYKNAQEYLTATSDAYARYASEVSAAATAAAELFFVENNLSKKTFSTTEQIHAYVEVAKERNGLDDETAAALENLLVLTNLTEEAVTAATAAVSAETDNLYANQQALEANATASEKAAAAKKDAEAAIRAHIAALFDERGQLTDAGRAALAANSYLADLVKTELDAQYAAAQANYTNLQMQILAVGKVAMWSSAQISAMFASLGFNTGTRLSDVERTAHALGLTTEEYLLQVAAGKVAQLSDLGTTVGGYAGSSSSGSSGGGSGSSSGSAANATLNALKAQITLLERQLSLMKARGDSTEVQIEKMREIQNALHIQADYLRSIGADEADILSLSISWWEYQNKIAELENQTADAIERALAAQEALNAAQSERTVRIYNAATGQWEWVADPNRVHSAQEDYDSAITGLSADELSQLSTQSYAYGTAAAAGAVLPGYGMRPAPAPASTGPSIGVQNNGNTYQLGGVTLTEAQAKTMTVYDLARLSSTLPIYAGTY